MRPPGAESFARRHFAALSSADDPFDECAFADETQNAEGRDREENDDCEQRDLRHGQVRQAAANRHASDANRHSAAVTSAASAPTGTAARDADEEPEQPERFTRAGVVEPLSDDLAYGHARLPVSGREAHLPVKAGEFRECDR